MSGLQWTVNVPDQPGWYWVREGDQSAEVVEVMSTSEGLRVWLSPDFWSFSAYESAVWYGPIEEPSYAG